MITPYSGWLVTKEVTLALSLQSPFASLSSFFSPPFLLCLLADMLKEAEILRRKNRHHYLIGGPNGLFIDGVKVLQHTHTHTHNIYIKQRKA